MIKDIYILWFQTFLKAPNIVKLCLESWRYHNPDWNINIINSNNLQEYISFKDDFIPLGRKNISLAAKSDIIRIILLKKYGGLWVDATTFCNRPLNEWLPQYITQGFFGFCNPGPDRLLSSWFLYGEPDNYIVNKWFERVKIYWINHNEVHDYFWFHGTVFGYIYKNDVKFKHIWNNVPKLSANLPHYLLSIFLKVLTPQIYDHIEQKISPLYKLSHKIDPKLYNNQISNKNSILYLLINTIQS